MIKKIIISFMIITTLFCNVSFATSGAYNLYKNKNSEEGKFLRQIFNDLRKTPISVSKNSIYYDTEIVCAIKAIRLCAGYYSLDHYDRISNKEAMDLAKYLIEERKNDNKAKKWYQRIMGD